MNSCQLVTFVSTLSCFISSFVNESQLDLLASLFTQLGDSLATIAINNSIICNKKEENTDNTIINLNN